MKNYENEILIIENIKSDYEKLSDKELIGFLYECCGILLIEAQKVEFIVHGLVAHFNKNILKTNKKFEKLTPRIFLDDDENSRKNRKQTLGNIINILLKNNTFFNESELNQYVQNRNIFVHSFWRDFLSGTKIESREEILNSIKFLMEFSKENIKWRSLFKGLLYLFAVICAENENKDIDLLKKYKPNYDDLIKYIGEQKNIC